jgi:hypothetical protein
MPSGLRAITALRVLREKAIKPLLAAAQEITPTRGAQNARAIDRHYQDLRHAYSGSASVQPTSMNRSLSMPRSVTTGPALP